MVGKIDLVQCQYCPQAAQVPCPNTFRGAAPNTRSASDFKTGQQNISGGVAPLKRDSLELSAENKIKETNKSGLSTGEKWALGILGSAAAIYGCVVGHRMLNKPTLEKVQKNFSEIFRRDVTKDEAEKLAKTYKEIFKIEDKKEFSEKLFEQAKKDFGYEKLDLRVGFFTKEEIAKNPKIGGGYRPVTPIFKEGKNGMSWLEKLNSEILKLNLDDDKDKLFDTIIHEFTHCKQHEYAYRYNKKEFYDALFESRFGSKNKFLSDFNMYKNAIESTYKDVWDKLPKIAENSKEAELAKKYLSDLKHYKSTSGGANINEYWNQFVEQEAREAGGKTKMIVKYFNQI